MRNSLKHRGNDADDTFEANLAVKSAKMIARALALSAVAVDFGFIWS
ncbi:MAG: hypothetical protein GJU76_00230 [Gallionella sp.]|jgi:hypothetical protein|nr:hypothetical protein [Gallionella sp.]